MLRIIRHEAQRAEQEARGRLERQKIADEAEAERIRRDLLELQSQSAAIESTGQAKAEAQSRAEAARIEGETAVEQASLKAKALDIEVVSLFIPCGCRFPVDLFRTFVLFVRLQKERFSCSF